MLNDLQLESVRKAANKAGRVFLELLFSGRTHKPECLLRFIVSEGSTWQVQVSRYLHRHFNGVACDDPLLVRSSNEIVQVQQTKLPHALTAFSIAVKGLFYSVPHGGFFIMPFRRGSTNQEKLFFKILRLSVLTTF